MTVSPLDALTFKMRCRNVPPPVYNEVNLRNGLLDERRSKRGNQNESGTICIPAIMMGTHQETNSSSETQPTALPQVENSNSEAQISDELSSQTRFQSFVKRSQLLDQMSSSCHTEHVPNRPDPPSPTSSTNNIPGESLRQNPSSPKPSTSPGLFEINNIVNNLLSTP